MKPNNLSKTVIKNLLVILLLSAVSLYAKNDAYINVAGNKISIGNNYIERVITVKRKELLLLKFLINFRAFFIMLMPMNLL